MSRFVKREVNSPQMRSVVVLILCTYFWIYLRPPQMLKFYTFWGAGESIGGGGQAPPGVRVILTLNTLRIQSVHHFVKLHALKIIDVFVIFREIVLRITVHVCSVAADCV